MKTFLLLSFAVMFAAAIFVVAPQMPGATLELIQVPRENNATTTLQENTQKEEKIVENLKEQIDSLADTVKNLKPPPAALTPTPPQTPAVRSEDIYAKALKAALNIFCIDNKANAYIFGSASIIHPSGYVMTNGHLAEHFQDPDTECTLRNGSPAKNYAKAKVVWMPDQSKKIGSSEIPEKDVAILKITKFMDGSAPVQDFEYFNIDEKYLPKPGEVLYSLNFPSEFLGAETAVTNTNMVFTLGTVDNVLTVDKDNSTAEGAYLKGELSAQHGSSGGIFLERQNGNIVGLFVGLTEGATTDQRRQFMFLASYINKIVQEEKGMSLSAYLNTNP